MIDYVLGLLREGLGTFLEVLTSKIETFVLGCSQREKNPIKISCFALP